MCSSFLIKDWREQKCFRPRYDVRGAFQGDRTTTSKKITLKILSCMFAGTQYLSRPDETRTPFSALTLVPRPLFPLLHVGSDHARIRFGRVAAELGAQIVKLFCEVWLLRWTYLADDPLSHNAS
jgi:hypothetical protein